MPYGDNCSHRRTELRLPGVDVVVLERRESQGMAGSRGDISPHIHSAGSVAVLVNVETTPVQLHAILFPSGDPAGQRISSYLRARWALYRPAVTPDHRKRLVVSSSRGIEIAWYSRS